MNIYFYIKNILLHPMAKGVAFLVLAVVISLGSATIISAPVAHASFGNLSLGPNGVTANGCADTKFGSIGGNSFGGGGSLSLSTNQKCNSAIGYAITILQIINTMIVPLIFAISFVVFIWGIFKYLIAGGDNPDERAKGWSLLLYGLIGFAIMISVWGFVNVILNTFNLDSTVPYYPQI